jgi:tetratricopeptide (TPR) repeat protein
MFGAMMVDASMPAQPGSGRRWRKLAMASAIALGLALPAAGQAQEVIWDAAIQAGQAALQRQDYNEAERQFEVALEAIEQLPDNDPRLGRTLNNLAAVYYATEDYARATPLMRRSLDLLEQSLGPNDPNVAQTMKNLAALYYLQDDLTAAEPLLERSLAIFEQTYGSDDARVATALSNLAGLRQAQNRTAEAEPLLARALSIWEGLLGPDHPDVAQSRALLEQVRETTTAEAAAAPAVPPPEFKPQELAVDQPATAQAPRLPIREQPARLARARPQADQSVAPALPISQQPLELPRAAAQNGAAETAPPNSYATYLSSLWSRESATTYWELLKVQAPDLFADKALGLQEVPAGEERGAYYRVLAQAFPDGPAANEFCRALKRKRDGQYCEVVRR